MTANAKLSDLAVRHALDLEKYGRGLTADVIKLLDEAEADLVAKLAARLVAISDRGYDTGPATTKRIAKLLDDLKDINSAVFKKVASLLEDELVELAGIEADYQASSLKHAIPVEIGATVPAPALLRTLVQTSPIDGAILSSWTAGMEVGTIDRIEREIRKGVFAGEGTDAIVRRIRGTKAKAYKDGILEISRRSARTLTRTATTHVANVAAQTTWKQNERVVKGWQFLAVLDSRTTTTCASKDGRVYPIGTGPIPPLHPACRSMSLPVTKSYREMGLDKDDLTPEQRASMDGQVAGTTTYPDWLKAQSATVQEQVLGVTKAKLFRDGKLSFSDLVSGDGSLLTLDDLRKKHSQLFS